MAVRVNGEVDIWLIFVWVLIEALHCMLSYQGLGNRPRVGVGIYKPLAEEGNAVYVPLSVGPSITFFLPSLLGLRPNP